MLLAKINQVYIGRVMARDQHFLAGSLALFAQSKC